MDRNLLPHLFTLLSEISIRLLDARWLNHQYVRQIHQYVRQIHQYVLLIYQYDFSDCLYSFSKNEKVLNRRK